MEKEQKTQSTNERMYDMARKILAGYQDALMGMPQFTQASAEMFLKQDEKGPISFSKDGARIEVEARNTPVSNFLRVTFKAEDYKRTSLIVINTGPLYGAGEKNGNFSAEKECLHLLADEETERVRNTGEKAIPMLEENLEKLNWIATKDFAGRAE